MPLSFEWDENKARSNFDKHGVTFEEASTVFADPLSLTIPDPDHSTNEDRFIIVGHLPNRDYWLSSIPNGEIIFALLVPVGQIGAKERTMKRESKKPDKPEMRTEYDFSRGQRGKYAKRYAQGSNVVVLDPDVAEYFPTSDAVNNSLRALAEIIKRQRKLA